VRTAGVVLLVPVLLVGRDGRGLHDRLAGTVVVHAPERRVGTGWS
jgi:uncharacterized RDD family membrane protein YckC